MTYQSKPETVWWFGTINALIASQTYSKLWDLLWHKNHALSSWNCCAHSHESCLADGPFAQRPSIEVIHLWLSSGLTIWRNAYLKKQVKPVLSKELSNAADKIQLMLKEDWKQELACDCIACCLAGKTTLLDALAGRKGKTGPNFQGRVLLNGKPAGKYLRRYSQYVPQEDAFVATLTTLETIKFRAGLTIPSSCPKTERAARIAAVIEVLGLRKVRDTKVSAGHSPWVNSHVGKYPVYHAKRVRCLAKTAPSCTVSVLKVNRSNYLIKAPEGYLDIKTFLKIPSQSPSWNCLQNLGTVVVCLIEVLKGWCEKPSMYIVQKICIVVAQTIVSCFSHSQRMLALARLSQSPKFRLFHKTSDFDKPWPPWYVNCFWGLRMCVIGNTYINMLIVSMLDIQFRLSPVERLNSV